MLLLSLAIFLTLIAATKQELYFNFISSNQLSSNDSALKLNNFTINNTSLSCLILVSIGHVYVVENEKCSEQCFNDIEFNQRNVTSGSCPLHPILNYKQLLKNNHDKECLFQLKVATELMIIKVTLMEHIFYQ